MKHLRVGFTTIGIVAVCAVAVSFLGGCGSSSEEAVTASVAQVEATPVATPAAAPVVTFTPVQTPAPVATPAPPLQTAEQIQQSRQNTATYSAPAANVTFGAKVSEFSNVLRSLNNQKDLARFQIMVGSMAFDTQQLKDELQRRDPVRNSAKCQMLGYMTGGLNSLREAAQSKSDSMDCADYMRDSKIAEFNLGLESARQMAILVDAFNQPSGTSNAEQH